MINYLLGALPWIQRRAELLLVHLHALEIPPSIEPHLEAQIVELEVIKSRPPKYYRSQKPKPDGKEHFVRADLMGQQVAEIVHNVTIGDVD